MFPWMELARLLWPLETLETIPRTIRIELGEALEARKIEDARLRRWGLRRGAKPRQQNILPKTTRATT